MNLYHYTKGYHIHEIIDCGEITPTKLGVPKGERPILWLSTNPRWEHTVSMTIGKSETERLGKGLYRIVIDSEKTTAYPWSRLRFLSQMHPGQADLLEQRAKDARANPQEWYGTFYPIPREEWVAIEVWRDEEWQSCGMLLLDAMSRSKKL